MGIIITIAVIAIIVLWIISVQRKLVGQDELCQNAMSTIGVQQESRWDAHTGMVELIKSYNEHEYNTLRDVIAQRRPIDGKSSAAEVDAQEGLMGQVAAGIYVAVERYPELKANENFIALQDELTGTENRVATERTRYNEAVKQYNVKIRKIPGVWFAGFMGMEPRKAFEAAAGAETAPKVEF